MNHFTISCATDIFTYFLYYREKVENDLSHSNYYNFREVVTMCDLLHPIILPKLYSSLLILYSLHNQSENDTYWKRVLKWNKHPDTTLLAFLGVDK